MIKLLKSIVKLPVKLLGMKARFAYRNRAVIVLILSTISGAFFSLKGKYIHERLMFDYANPKVYKVTNFIERGSGTGSIVQLANGRKVVLTNRHVCTLKDSLDNVVLIDHRGTRFTRRVIAMDNEHDLCAIEPVSDRDSALKVASKAPGLGDHVFVVGHPSGRATTLQYGMLIELAYSATVTYGSTGDADCWGKFISINEIISEIEKKNGKPLDPIQKEFVKFMYGMGLCTKTLISYMSSAAGEPGNSGSPVMDFYGNVIAVLYAGNNSPHMSILVPHSAIVTFLKKLQ